MIERNDSNQAGVFDIADVWGENDSSQHTSMETFRRSEELGANMSALRDEGYLRLQNAVSKQQAVEGAQLLVRDMCEAIITGNIGIRDSADVARLATATLYTLRQRDTRSAGFDVASGLADKITHKNMPPEFLAYEFAKGLGQQALAVGDTKRDEGAKYPLWVPLMEGVMMLLYDETMRDRDKSLKEDVVPVVRAMYLLEGFLRRASLIQSPYKSQSAREVVAPMVMTRKFLWQPQIASRFRIA